MTLQVDVWSDVVCPWCCIGKRRLEQALAGFEHADGVEVVYRSFQLEPDAAPFTPGRPPRDLATHLGTRYGGGRAQGLQMLAQVTEVAAGDGLAFDLEHAQGESTLDAHRLLHAALDQGGPALQGALKEQLLQAYFLQGRNISDPAVLLELAQSAGLDGDRARAVLAGDEYAEQVRDDQDQARALGVTGVPFVVLGGRYAVAGAQSVEVFARALAQAWSAVAP